MSFISLKKTALFSLLLLIGAVSPIFAQNDAMAPVFLTANDLSIATGEPSLVPFSNGSAQVPVWSLSGGTVGQSVSGVVAGLPSRCAGVRVEIVVMTNEAAADSALEDVFRVYLSPIQSDAPLLTGAVQGTPVRTPLTDGPFLFRTIELESFFPVDPNEPLLIRIGREPGDPADTFTRPVGLALVKITPLPALLASNTVQDVSGYNSWPVIEALGDKLVCVYSRGKGHDIVEDIRAVYARTSNDGGKTWTDETVVANTPGDGEVTIGKGLDSTGAMLLWVRRIGKEWNHDLYRSTDGVTFTRIATPKLDPIPVQITDLFFVPNVGLMALWFAGNYNDDASHSWGTLTSEDDGATWTQRVVESGLTKTDWPTEPSAVYLGEGKILAVARSESAAATTERAQFQLISTDSGKTWTRSVTNIGDVLASTPSLNLDSETGLLSNYYYHRGRGVLRRRVVRPESVFDHPLAWPKPEPVTLGSDATYDAGNVNATFIGQKHYLAYYSGKGADTAVLVFEANAPVNDAQKTPDTP